MNTSSSTRIQALREQARLVLKSNLEPCDTSLIQLPTFQDIGFSIYTVPDGRNTQNAIVDTHASVANRLEAAIWDHENHIPIACCAKIPYVQAVKSNGSRIISSQEESHRLNSPYLFKSTLTDGTRLEDVLGDALKATEGDRSAVARVFAQYDPLSLLHGTFMSFSPKFAVNGSPVKVTRSLSGFIEAFDVSPVEYGTQRNDRLDSRQQKDDGNGKKSGGYGTSKEGYGTLQASATLWACNSIKASFFLDIDLLRSYGLGDVFVDWAIAVALLKIWRFLDRGLRLRSKCNLITVGDEPLYVTAPLTMQGAYSAKIGLDESMLAPLVKDLTHQLVDDGLFGSKLTVTNEIVSKGMK